MARRSKRQAALSGGTVKAIGYIRVSTEGQAVSGLSLEHQRAMIAKDAERLGYDLVAIYEDAGKSGKTTKREAYQQALAAMLAGEAQVLMFAEGDRMTRKLEDWAQTVNLSQLYGFQLCDGGSIVDVQSANGFMFAGIKAVVAQAERMKIAERTRAALAAKKAQGHRLGRPVQLAADVHQRVLALRAEGHSMAKIADLLNAQSVPTATGGKWHGSTVQNVLSRAQVLA